MDKMNPANISPSRVTALYNERDRLRAENERLQKEYADLKSCHDDHYRDFLAIGAENERLRTALGEYANCENWGHYHTKFVDVTYWRQDMDDPGGVARAALKGDH